MENKEDILKKLNNNDPELLHEAIEEIKNNGDLSIIPSLLDILEISDNYNRTNEIINLLADIKENAFKDILINRIQTATNIQFKTSLLRICWESALDYSKDIDLFINILLQDDFEPALEASTIINELISHLNNEKRQEIISLLQTTSYSTSKKFLIEDLIAQITE